MVDVLSVADGAVLGGLVLGSDGCCVGCCIVGSVLGLVGSLLVCADT